MFSVKYSTKSQEFRPVEDTEDETVYQDNHTYSTEKLKSPVKKILQMDIVHPPWEETDADEVLKKDTPAKRRRKLFRFAEGQNPDKKPSYACRKSRTYNSPDMDKNIIGDRIEEDSGEQDKHLCPRTTSRREDLKIDLQEKIKDQKRRRIE